MYVFFFFTFSFIKALKTNSSKFRNHKTKMTRRKKSSNVEELPALSVFCRKFAGLICFFARYAGKELSLFRYNFLLSLHSDISRL